jgi:hypothetical protein
VTGDDLARQLALVAGDLDAKHYPYAAVVRRAARALVALEADPPDPDGCAGCGQALTGRRRRWCSEACRSRVRRR